MDFIKGGRIGLSLSTSTNRFTLYCLIASTLVLAMIVASCGVIPGGKESHAVVKSFMEVAVAKDIDNACACFASPVEEQMRKDIEGLILGNYQLFEGYQDVKMRGINVQMSKPHDTAEYSGEVTYSGDFQGWVEARLVKQGEVWKLTGVNVEISQEKLDDYNKRHGGS